MPMKAVPANAGVPETGSPSWDASSIFPSVDLAADDASSFLAEYESLSVRLSAAKTLLEALLRTEEAREDDSEVAPSFRGRRSRRRRRGRRSCSSRGPNEVVVGEGADGEEELERTRKRRTTRTDRRSSRSSSLRSRRAADRDERASAASSASVAKRRRRSGVAGGRTGYAGDVSDHLEVAEPSSLLRDDSGDAIFVGASTTNSTFSAAVSEKRAGECETVVGSIQNTKNYFNSACQDGDDDFPPQTRPANGIFLNVPKRRRKARRRSGGNGKKEASASALWSQGSQQLLCGNSTIGAQSCRATSFIHPEIDLSLVKHVVVPAGSLWSPSLPSTLPPTPLLSMQSNPANDKVDEATQNAPPAKTEAREGTGNSKNERRGSQVRLSHPVQLGEALAFSDRARLIVEADPPHNVAHFNAAYESLASRRNSSLKGKAAAAASEANVAPCTVGRPLFPAGHSGPADEKDASRARYILDLVARRVTMEGSGGGGGGPGGTAAAAVVAVHPILSDVPPQQQRTAHLFDHRYGSRRRRSSDGAALDNGEGGNGCRKNDGGGTKSTHYLVEIVPATTTAAEKAHNSLGGEAAEEELSTATTMAKTTTMASSSDVGPMTAVRAVG